MSIPTGMKSDKKEFILWCDVETTGVDPDSDALLEIAGIITDMAGNRIGRHFTSLVYYPDVGKIINMCNDSAAQMHYKSGLFEDLWCGGVQLDELDQMFVNWVHETVDVDNSILYFGGRSITFDRNVIANNLPLSFNLFSYRSIDMTSITLLIDRNNLTDDKKASWVREADHRALNDCEDCITQYRNVIKAFSPVTKDNSLKV